MLIISRREMERLWLVFGETRVEVQVTEIRRSGSVRLGITAPDWIHIERDDMKCGQKPSAVNLKQPEAE